MTVFVGGAVLLFPIYIFATMIIVGDADAGDKTRALTAWMIILLFHTLLSAVIASLAILLSTKPNPNNRLLSGRNLAYVILLSFSVVLLIFSLW